jgi:hypothetical protein
MTAGERIADRIAKNRAIERNLFSGKAGMSLESIVALLDQNRQRATYAAVAELVGVLPRGLMSGRAKSARYSWVVAATNGRESRRGWPTGYTLEQIDPECLKQINRGYANVIETAHELRSWLLAKQITGA